MQRLLILLLCAAVAAVLPHAAAAEPVDHIAASVNNDVITASELSQTMALNERLGTSGRSGIAMQTSDCLTFRNRTMGKQVTRS